MCYNIILYNKNVQYYYLYIIIVADEPIDCKDYDVRLQKGTDSSNGRLHICQNRHWFSVCSEESDLIKAKLVCQTLNLNPKGIFPGEEIIRVKVFSKLDARDIRIAEVASPPAVKVNCNSRDNYLNECTVHKDNVCTFAAMACGKHSGEVS